MEIKIAKTETDILKCLDAMLAFIEEDDKASAVVGFRYLQFLYNGKHFYIDDLSTLPASRGKGLWRNVIRLCNSACKRKGI